MYFVYLATCPPLYLEGGIFVRRGGNVGDLATYKCESGYSLSGSEYRLCLGTGKWSGDQPSCRRRSKFVCKSDDFLPKISPLMTNILLVGKYNFTLSRKR